MCEEALRVLFNVLVMHTVPNLHFLSKNPTLICQENCRFFGVKNSWKCCGIGHFSCWQLWFHEKNCQKKFALKTRENVGDLSKLIFWQKFDFSNSVSCEVSACSQHDMQSSTLISFLQFRLDLYIMCIQREEPTLNIFCLFQISFSLEISTKRESSFLLPPSSLF